MNIKNKPVYSDQTLEICKHARIISNIDRIYIIKVIKEYQKCRVTQIAMETGLGTRQVYYQLSVLRKMNYISTRFDKGRYFVYPSFGMQRGAHLLNSLLKKDEEDTPLKHPHLRIVR